MGSCRIPLWVLGFTPVGCLATSTKVVVTQRHYCYGRMYITISHWTTRSVFLFFIFFYMCYYTGDVAFGKHGEGLLLSLLPSFYCLVYCSFYCSFYCQATAPSHPQTLSVSLSLSSSSSHPIIYIKVQCSYSTRTCTDVHVA